MAHTEITICSAATAHPVVTLADVLVVLEQHPDIRADRRRNMISAVRCLCSVLGAYPRAITVAPTQLRKRIDSVHWQATGLSRSYISNLKTLTLSALKISGVEVLSSRASGCLSPAWAALQAQVADQTIWCPLSRFARFCTAHDIQPEQATEAVLTRFGAVLHEQSLKSDPAGSIRKIRWAWSKAAALSDKAVPCLPPAKKMSRRYSLNWDSFPPGFAADVDAFTAARSNPNPFAQDYFKPVADTTAALRRKQIQQIASALVSSGVPASEVTSLSMLTNMDNAEAALTYLYERAGSKQTPYLGQQALLLKTIAKFWVKAPDETIKRLNELAANLSVRRAGMVARNRERLRQFDLEENVDLLLRLPPKVFADLQAKTQLSVNDLARGVYSAAVEILLHAPIRVASLCNLELGTQVVAVRHGASVAFHIALPKTKNGDSYEAAIPADSSRWLDYYIQDIRPALSAVPSSHLFPNQLGERRSAIAFSRGIETFIARETGLQVNSHLFRAFAVLLERRMNPGDRETPRQLLGHRSSATTERAYTVLDSAGAARRHDALIAALRDRHASQTSKHRLPGRAP